MPKNENNFLFPALINRSMNPTLHPPGLRMTLMIGEDGLASESLSD